MPPDRVWGLRSARIKKLKKTDPHIKKWGSVFYNFFIQATVQSQIAICSCANNLHVKFSKKSKFSFCPPQPQSHLKPKVIYMDGNLIQFLKVGTSQNFGFGPWGPVKSLWKKLAKNYGGETYLYPQNPPFWAQNEKKTYFFTILIQFWVEDL